MLWRNGVTHLILPIYIGNTPLTALIHQPLSLYKFQIFQYTFQNRENIGGTFAIYIWYAAATSPHVRRRK